MSRSDSIPGPAVRRLSLYLRQLESSLGVGKHTVSSRQLGQALGLTDAQVRKDLAYFGQFGRPGIGYDVDDLITQIRRILGTDRVWNVLLIGAGNLGRALLCYRGFAKKGFHLVAVFDKDDSLIGRTVEGAPGVVVQPLSDLPNVVREHNVHLAILAVPASAAQEAADCALKAGVRGILNFAPVTLQGLSCAMASVDLTVHLEQLSFQLGGGDTA
jgi:redox-sensing transcriptional repressor